MPDLSVSRTVDESPEAVWAVVSDPTGYGQFSPENTGATWLKGATGPAVGVDFKGTNAKGSMRWSTKATVTDCDEPNRFGFHVTAFGLKVAQWDYVMELTDTGCTITHEWTRTENPTVARILDRLMRIPDRRALNEQNMGTTLDGMVAHLEP